MTTRSKLICVIAAWLPLACMKPNPLIYTLGDDDTSESGTSDESDSGDSNSGDVPLDIQTDEVCGSIEPYAPACGTCLSLGCCDLLAACTEIDDCTCLAACLLDGGNNGACRQACNGTQPNDIPPLQPLLDCATDSCDADCQ